MKTRRPCQSIRQGGFTFLGLLLAVALMGIGLTAASEVWFTTAQRQRAEQSRWVAEEFVRAIGSYYESGPGGVKQFPAQLEDLLEDRRGPVVRRHLRQVYLNPYTGTREWVGVAAPGGGIRGIKIKTWTPLESGHVLQEYVYVPIQPPPATGR